MRTKNDKDFSFFQFTINSLLSDNFSIPPLQMTQIQAIKQIKAQLTTKPEQKQLSIISDSFKATNQLTVEQAQFIFDQILTVQLQQTDSSRVAVAFAFSKLCQTIIQHQIVLLDFKSQLPDLIQSYPVTDAQKIDILVEFITVIVDTDLFDPETQRIIYNLSASLFDVPLKNTEQKCKVQTLYNTVLTRICAINEEFALEIAASPAANPMAIVEAILQIPDSNGKAQLIDFICTRTGPEDVMISRSYYELSFPVDQINTQSPNVVCRFKQDTPYLAALYQLTQLYSEDLSQLQADKLFKLLTEIWKNSDIGAKNYIMCEILENHKIGADATCELLNQMAHILDQKHSAQQAQVMTAKSIDDIIVIIDSRQQVLLFDRSLHQLYIMLLQNSKNQQLSEEAINSLFTFASGLVQFFPIGIKYLIELIEMIQTVNNSEEEVSEGIIQHIFEVVKRYLESTKQYQYGLDCLYEAIPIAFKILHVKSFEKLILLSINALNVFYSSNSAQDNDFSIDNVRTVFIQNNVKDKRFERILQLFGIITNDKQIMALEAFCQSTIDSVITNQEKPLQQYILINIFGSFIENQTNILIKSVQQKKFQQIINIANNSETCSATIINIQHLLWRCWILAQLASNSDIPEVQYFKDNMSDTTYILSCDMFYFIETTRELATSKPIFDLLINNFLDIYRMIITGEYKVDGLSKMTIVASQAYELGENLEHILSAEQQNLVQSFTTTHIFTQLDFTAQTAVCNVVLNLLQRKILRQIDYSEKLLKQALNTIIDNAVQHDIWADILRVLSNACLTTADQKEFDRMIEFIELMYQSNTFLSQLISEQEAHCVVCESLTRLGQQICIKQPQLIQNHIALLGQVIVTLEQMPMGQQFVISKVFELISDISPQLQEPYTIFSMTQIASEGVFQACFLKGLDSSFLMQCVAKTIGALQRSILYQIKDSLQSLIDQLILTIVNDDTVVELGLQIARKLDENDAVAAILRLKRIFDGMYEERQVDLKMQMTAQIKLFSLTKPQLQLAQVVSDFSDLSQEQTVRLADGLFKNLPGQKDVVRQVIVFRAMAALFPSLAESNTQEVIKNHFDEIAADPICAMLVQQRVLKNLVGNEEILEKALQLTQRIVLTKPRDCDSLVDVENLRLREGLVITPQNTAILRRISVSQSLRLLRKTQGPRVDAAAKELYLRALGSDCQREVAEFYFGFKQDGMHLKKVFNATVATNDRELMLTYFKQLASVCQLE